MLVSDAEQSDSHIFFQILSIIFLDRFICLSVAELGPRCSGGLSLVTASGGCSCGSAQALSEGASAAVSTVLAAKGLRDLPGQGIESMSSVLQGELVATRPPGKSPSITGFSQDTAHSFSCAIQ